MTAPTSTSTYITTSSATANQFEPYATSFTPNDKVLISWDADESTYLRAFYFRGGDSSEDALNEYEKNLTEEETSLLGMRDTGPYALPIMCASVTDIVTFCNRTQSLNPFNNNNGSVNIDPDTMINIPSGVYNVLLEYSYNNADAKVTVTGSSLVTYTATSTSASSTTSAASDSSATARPTVAGASSVTTGSSSSTPTSTSSVSSSSSSSSSSGLSKGAIAGIAVGAVLGVALIALAIFFLCRRRKRQAAQPAWANKNGSGTPSNMQRDLAAEKAEIVGGSAEGLNHEMESLHQSNVDAGPHADQHQDLAAGPARAPYSESQASHRAPDSFRGSYHDVPTTNTSAMRDASPTPQNLQHMYEPGMTAEDIARLEEEERRIDEAIAAAESRRTGSN